jgi:hypothetical protein
VYFYNSNETNYLKTKKLKFNLKNLTSNLNKCQRVCLQLDKAENKSEQPTIQWYWPSNKEKPKREKVEPINQSNEEEEENESDKYINTIIDRAERNENKDAKLIYEESLNRFLNNKSQLSIKDNNPPRTSQDDNDKDEFDFDHVYIKCEQRDVELDGYSDDEISNESEDSESHNSFQDLSQKVEVLFQVFFTNSKKIQINLL